MLEVLINNPSDRKGEAKIMSATAYNGTFCYISGFNADGYTLLKLPYNSAQSLKAIYPVNKYYYPEDLSDTSDAVDKLSTGDSVIYYSGEGEYITDKWCPASFGLTSPYWSTAAFGALSSAYGAKITSPGTDSAAATNAGLWKCWVSTATTKTGAGTANERSLGYLVGTSLGLFDDETSPNATNGYVARVIRIFGADSADAKLHFRLTPHWNARSAI